jgi:hypothetical protein
LFICNKNFQSLGFPSCTFIHTILNEGLSWPHSWLAPLFCPPFGHKAKFATKRMNRSQFLELKKRIYIWKTMRSLQYDHIYIKKIWVWPTKVYMSVGQIFFSPQILVRIKKWHMWISLRVISGLIFHMLNVTHCDVWHIDIRKLCQISKMLISSLVIRSRAKYNG